jgi:hypothetical protein
MASLMIGGTHKSLFHGVQFFHCLTLWRLLRISPR